MNQSALPRSEHPRPDFERADWLCLNGQWQFAESDENEQQLRLSDAPYPDEITVPFCRESELSGLGRKGFVNHVWYRRTFERPADWTAPRTLLHIGASDWKTEVWVNGRRVGEHIGGSAAFAFDVTSALVEGQNTVVIHAFDDTRSGLQALGKQCPQLESFGCLYTRTTGIWQSVWLEGVGNTYIKGFQITTDVDNSRLLIEAQVEGPCTGLTLQAVAKAAGKLAGRETIPLDWRNNHLVLDLSEKRLWSPNDPFLYDLELAVMEGDQVVDRVASYFGLRKISIKGAAILLNDEPVFQRLVLDQGFYPDGIWTASSDAELKADIERSMACGFNGARLHQKVFEPRFLYWADKLGYMVWGEFPNWGLNYENPAIDQPVMSEWAEVVQRDRNHPSIVGWCPFNETPPSAIRLQNAVVGLTRKLDPSRPVIDTSGWTHGLADPEVMDQHDYDQNPESFRKRWLDDYEVGMLAPAPYGAGSGLLPFFVSEWGGIGWDTGAAGWGYGNAPKSLDEFYARLEGLTDALLDNALMFGFCYTQLTDVEQERNGMYTYDRQPKFDAPRVRAILSKPAAFEQTPPTEVNAPKVTWKVLSPSANEGDADWRYTLETPNGNWQVAEYDDSTWQTGQAPFGAKEGWEKRINTPWTTKDLWVRRAFNWDGNDFDLALLGIHYDNDTEVYVNGQLIWQADRWNDRYQAFDITDTLKDALVEGPNTLAAHCWQDTGGQFLDLAVLVGVE